MQPNFQEAISRGIAWLDEQHPGWEGKIDLRTLDLSNSCFCVLGQLEMSYGRALARIIEAGAIGEADRFSSSIWANRRAFTFLGGLPDEWTQLTAAWKTAITQRLAGKGI